MSGPDDSPWRRPPDGDAAAPSPVAAGGLGVPAVPAYPGPPRGAPPAPDWRPEFVVEPHPPRALSQQDHAALDAQEAAARRLTYLVGVVAGGIMLLGLFALCLRATF